MKIAYVLLAHRDPQQLLRLIRRLSSPQASFFVHIDRYADDSIYDAVKIGAASRNDTVLVRRHRCLWGGFGIIRATLELLDAAAAHGGYDATVLLSGQDYPVRPVPEIERALESQTGASYLSYFRLPDEQWAGGGMSRVTGWHWNGRVFGKHVMFPHPRLPALRTWERHFPSGFDPYGGGGWWGLSRPALDYVRTFVRHERAFVRYYRHVYLPDESFFQTILLNSPLADTVENDDLHYVDWSTGKSNPKMLEVENIERAISSGKPFARKFNDEAVLDAIDERVHGGPA